MIVQEKKTCCKNIQFWASVQCAKKLSILHQEFVSTYFDKFGSTEDQ